MFKSCRKASKTNSSLTIGKMLDVLFLRPAKRSAVKAFRICSFGTSPSEEDSGTGSAAIAQALLIGKNTEARRISSKARPPPAQQIPAACPDREAG